MAESGRGYNGPKLDGSGMTVEADETYHRPKGSRTAPMVLTRRPSTPWRLWVERGGKVRSFHVPNVTANNLYPIVARHTHTDSRFMTDETGVYALRSGARSKVAMRGSTIP